jgi:hypothetical protein
MCQILPAPDVPDLPTCGQPSTPTPSPTPAPTPPPGSNVLYAAGDIAECGSELRDEQTGDVIEADPSAIVLTLGDNAYESGTLGTLTEFNDCYTPACGSFKDRTKPSVGNHEYNTSGASGYCAYFGAVASCPQAYYAYNYGDWRLYALNTECGESSVPGGCAAQRQWLANDVATNPAVCRLAYYHHPRLTAGPHANGEGDDSLTLWRALYDHGFDLVLVGHDHSYQRYAPLNRDGTGPEAGGLTEIVNGAGGKGVTTQTSTPSGLEAYMDGVKSNLGNSSSLVNVAGVLKVTLGDGTFSWQFLPVPGKTYTDSGTRSCR